MPYPVTPFAGARIGEINAPFTPKLGTVVTAEDGHDYILAKASGAIANAAVAILTEPAMTMATGAGAWTNTNAALVLNDLAWFKKTAI
jgi:hypothetical protein